MQPEVIEVSNSQVSCDGGALGHPKVYLNLGTVGKVVCPYCSRTFVQVRSKHNG